MNNCRAKTNSGDACRARPVNGSHWCQMHQPGAAKELSSRGVDARRREREAARAEAAKRLKVPADGREVNDLIRHCLGEVKAGLLDPEIARAVSGLAGVFFRGVETVELEQRIAAIEERQQRAQAEKA